MRLLIITLFLFGSFAAKSQGYPLLNNTNSTNFSITRAFFDDSNFTAVGLGYTINSKFDFGFLAGSQKYNNDYGFTYGTQFNFYPINGQKLNFGINTSYLKFKNDFYNGRNLNYGSTVIVKTGNQNKPITLLINVSLINEKFKLINQRRSDFRKEKYFAVQLGCAFSFRTNGNYFTIYPSYTYSRRSLLSLSLIYSALNSL